MKDLNKQLIHCCIHGNYDKVVDLIDSGADIHYNDDQPIYEASIFGNLRIAKYLIEQGVNIHSHDDIAFIYSCEYGRLDIVKYLVEKGANIHIFNNYGIWVAQYTRHNKVVEYLKSLGCVLDEKKSDEHYDRYWEMM